jgi:Domain of unknown function (DUF4286)
LFHRFSIMNKVLYNVTVSVDEAIHEEWVNWMKSIHIPDVMATGLFLSNKLLRVHGHEENGLTYAVQYLAEDRQKLDTYFATYAPRLQQEHTLKYGSRAVAFRTILEIIHEIDG